MDQCGKRASSGMCRSEWSGADTGLVAGAAVLGAIAGGLLGAVLFGVAVTGGGIDGGLVGSAWAGAWVCGCMAFKRRRARTRG